MMTEEKIKVNFISYRYYMSMFRLTDNLRYGHFTPELKLVPIRRPRWDDILGWSGACVSAYSFTPRL